MTLKQGARLGAYEVVASLGAGGMGEVYKARDTRLERLVAVKILPSWAADDPDARARFEREAKSISQLHHPNICVLHDIGAAPVQEPGGLGDAAPQAPVHYLVMEYLEGESLAARLHRGPLPVDEALGYAIEIADALARAHRQGIVHRDLKPANVMLARQERRQATATAKLLDFGLAKLAPSASAVTIESGATVSAPPSPGEPVTARGTLLGTFQYMSPEQLEGQDVDARSDIWAFGCMLYEMLTGKRPFDGATQASVIGAILERQPPPVVELQPLTPLALDRVVRTCLAKDPDARFQSAHDVLLQLRWIREGGSAAGLPASVVSKRKRREWMAWLAIATTLSLLAGTAAWLLKPAPAVPQRAVSFTYTLPKDQAFTAIGRRVLTVSPDGTRLVYVANNQLYLRDLNAFAAQPIAGTNENPTCPVFSPDGQWVAYFTQARPGNFVLKKVLVSGGTPVSLAQTGAPFGVSWHRDTIVFSQSTASLPGIGAVPDSGGPVRALVTVDVTEQATQPQLLDDGVHLIFAVHKGGIGGVYTDDIVVDAVGGGQRKVLVRGGTSPRILRGRLVYFSSGTLFGVPFDERALATTGAAVAVLEDVLGASAQSGQFVLSDAGTLAFIPASPRNLLRELVWVDRKGREEKIDAPPHEYQYPRISPDGTRLVVSARDGDQNLWTWDLVQRRFSRLTFESRANEQYPAWSPDSRDVFYQAVVDGRNSLWRIPANGAGQASPVADLDALPYAVMPDGASLVYSAITGVGSDFDVMWLALAAPAEHRPLVQTRFREWNAELSPDGRWLAYCSNESGRVEIYVRPFPDVNANRWQITSVGGDNPVWSRDGRELFFAEPERPSLRYHLASVRVQPGASFAHGDPEILFYLDAYFGNGVVGRTYDVSPDGRRFLLIKPLATPAPARDIAVATHWLDDLKARVK